MNAKDGGFVMPDPGVPRIPLERLDLESAQAERYVAEHRPFVARVDWPALQWTPESLRTQVGTTKVKVFKRTGEGVELTISEFLDLVDLGEDATREYVMQNFPAMKLWGEGVIPGMEPLLPGLRLPSYIRTEQLREGYVWARNLGWHDNKSHAEPNASSAFNLQILGKKHVWLFSPEDAGLIGAASKREEMMTPPFFSATQTVFHPTEEHPEFKDVRCYETILEPGDLIHIPTFWYHWFVHYDHYQMNCNLWFTPESIPLTPIAGEWAFMNALVLTLGGHLVANEKFAALPLETQELLTRIANRLVEDRTCTDRMTLRRALAKVKSEWIEVDEKVFDQKVKG